jgi:hypothetical protein
MWMMMDELGRPAVRRLGTQRLESPSRLRSRGRVRSRSYLHRGCMNGGCRCVGIYSVRRLEIQSRATGIPWISLVICSRSALSLSLPSRCRRGNPKVCRVRRTHRRRCVVAVVVVERAGAPPSRSRADLKRRLSSELYAEKTRMERLGWEDSDGKTRMG